MPCSEPKGTNLAFKVIVKRALSQMGYEVRRIPVAATETFEPRSFPYCERPEYGPSNIETKLENEAKGLPFEYKNIKVLNEVVAELVGDDHKIVEFGSGTGMFLRAAARAKERIILGSEYHTLTYEWCKRNLKDLDNVQIINGPISKEMNDFDLAVAIEIIEHIYDYASFLSMMSKIAKRAIITTPNRRRSPEAYHAGPPNHIKHVREWTAGEFYWILRCFWNDVKLYSTSHPEEKRLIKIDVDSNSYHLISVCSSAKDHSNWFE